MSGNREIYDQEMNAGLEAAWIQDWKVAAEHYGRAIQQFPDDPEAHLNLGFALLSADRLNEAFKVYTRAAQLAPNDPIPLEKSADVMERMGRLKEAAQQYASVAERYLQQRDIDKAISNWEKATTLTPGLVALHAKLAKAYRKIGDRKRAVFHFMTLAYNLSQKGDNHQARQAVEQALALNKKNVEAVNALQALEAGAKVKPPTPVAVNEPIEVDSALGSLNWDDIVDDTTTKESDPLGPMGEAMNHALENLATQIMMSGGFDAGGVEALQAMELQRQGVHGDAINAYQSAAKSMNVPALQMNLGALLLLSEQPAEAIQPLNAASQDTEMRTGAFHALGQAYYNQQKFKRALNFLLETAQIVESGLAKSDDDRKLVNHIYTTLLETISRRSESDQLLMAVGRRMQRLLSGKEWERRLQDVRYQLADAMRDGGGERMLELLSEDIAEGITDSVARIDRYIRQNLFTLAMDEAQYAIEHAPSYLPIHVRMAEIMMAEGRVRQAITKYNTVAKTYRVRGENGRAASILFEVLEMAPLDLDVRANLIELLEEEERWEDTLEQYVELASTYRELGNLDQGRETYVAAEKLSQRVDVPSETIIRIKHAIADIDQLRMDIRRAQRVYEEIIEINNTDERARKGLVDINLQMGNQIEGIKQLDELLRLYAKRKQVKNILNLLQELVRHYPDDGGLRSRLAAFYRQLGRKEDAVEQLDKLANIQLDAGLTQDACETVKQIIGLNPPNVADFKEAYSKLGCQ
jgi:tetratricopeptide (TPR) repeat protein